MSARPKTFAAFRKRYGIRPNPYGKLSIEASKRGEEVCHLVFADDVPRDARWDLFHLRDFVVSSSVSGPGYVLCPRSPK